MDSKSFKEKCEAIIDNIEKIIIGKRNVLQLILAGILSRGHILLEDLPGLGKTLTTKSFAESMNVSFKRIQFTPDLLPGDLTGSYIYNPKNQEFIFNKGPIFANIILADEINRANPKSQSALLECMEEKQVTVEGNTSKLDMPFNVIATQNPIEFEGTYPLPEAQLDRFLLKLSIGYPDNTSEIEILSNRESRKKDEVKLDPVLNKDEVIEMSNYIETVYTSPELKEYIVKIVDKTRNNSNLQMGASPRGSLALFKVGKALAAINGRNYITPDDIKTIVPFVLSHRIILNTDLWIRNVQPEEILHNILNDIPVPDVVEMVK